MSFAVRRLGPDDVALAMELNALFAVAFEDSDTYAAKPPSRSYLRKALGRRETIVLVALENNRIIGGLMAYVLDKLEQERSEIYIYDLAVAQEHRRRGLATALIAELRAIARGIGAWMVYVQADYGDDPAIALYEGLGTREDLMHFDIAPASTR